MTTTTTVPAASKRMTLAAVSSGKQAKAWRILLYGTEGVGKTTFASQCPAPIFLGVEDGSAHLDVARFPSPQSWLEVREAVQQLIDGPHEYKTLVVDTVDAAEPLLWAHIVRRDTTSKQPLSSIEDYGYGKGYQVALDEWRSFLAQLERLRERSVNVLLLGHSLLRTFKNPEGEDFDRYELKLHAKSAGLLKEWADAVLFANYETIASKDARTRRVRGVSTGVRLLHTVRTAAFDAKNRMNLPDSMVFDYAEFSSLLGGQSAAALLEAIQAKAAGLSTDLREKVTAAISRANGSTEKLAQLNTWINAQASQPEAKREN